MITPEVHIAPSQNAANAEAVVQISDLYKSFGPKKVLNGVTLTLNQGDSLVVIGHSGCGKSVLIKCMIGLVKPESGNLFVLGTNMMTASRHEVNLLRSRIGFLFQSNALYDSMNVKENLLFTLQRRRKDITTKEKDMLVDEVLRNVGLPGTANLMPEELSGGMKKE